MKRAVIIIVGLFNLLLLIGIQSRSLHFGMGLGDIIMQMVFWGYLFIVALYSYFYFNNKDFNIWIFIVSTSLILAVTLFVTLMVTILRGPEVLWDGNIFP